MVRKKPVGWRGEPQRHAAAARGEKSGRRFMPIELRQQHRTEPMDEDELERVWKRIDLLEGRLGT